MATIFFWPAAATPGQTRYGRRGHYQTTMEVTDELAAKMDVAAVFSAPQADLRWGEEERRACSSPAAEDWRTAFRRVDLVDDEVVAARATRRRRVRRAERARRAIDGAAGQAMALLVGGAPVWSYTGLRSN